jgi:UDP-N-acetylglucosamine 1-carboxyvinyltransferase
VLLASVLAKGTTVIENAAREPEIADLADMLNEMGANVRGAGTKTITVTGVPVLHGCRHKVIPDRIEAATYIIAAAITKGDVTLSDVNADHIGIIISKLRQAGLSVNVAGSAVRAKWTGSLKPVSVKTEVYPGFPTDVQAQWMALMTTVKGTSTLEETVFENRFLHVCELQRFGASLHIDGRKVKVQGVKSISGAPVMVSDLRAGAALVLAGLAAQGKTEIQRIYHLDRGYEQLEKKLLSLGARIRRMRA